MMNLEGSEVSYLRHYSNICLEGLTKTIESPVYLALGLGIKPSTSKT